MSYIVAYCGCLPVVAFDRDPVPGSLSTCPAQMCWVGLNVFRKGGCDDDVRNTCE